MQQAKRKRSYLGLIIVVSTLAILMLILIVAVVMLFVSSQLGLADSVSSGLLGTNANPLDMIEVEKVDPALALASLGGVSEAEVIREAIHKARPETALSALLFEPTLTDRESASNFLSLAAAYPVPEEQAKAILCYRMAGTIAILSPTIPDTGRADIFLQAGEGLIELEENVWAKFYLDQAFIVAARSPSLQAVQRRAIFARLQKNYIAIKERALARESLNISANPPPLGPPIPTDPILPPSEPVPLALVVQEAEAERWMRAQELAAILVERGGKAPQEAQQALQAALIAEDRQKLSFYRTEMATTARLTKKIDITMAQIDWLSIKYKVARRAYGISLVPEWEAEAGQIRADLTKTYETLYALYADLIVALPEASQIDKATEERLRREILAGELGRYPNYPEEQRQRQLLEATAHLLETQPDIQLFVGIDTIAGQERYTLVTLPE